MVLNKVCITILAVPGWVFLPGMQMGNRERKSELLLCTKDGRNWCKLHVSWVDCERLGAIGKLGQENMHTHTSANIHACMHTHSWLVRLELFGLTICGITDTLPSSTQFCGGSDGGKKKYY
jgi:hypothetical protein